MFSERFETKLTVNLTLFEKYWFTPCFGRYFKDSTIPDWKKMLYEIKARKKKLHLFDITFYLNLRSSEILNVSKRIIIISTIKDK